MTPKEVFQLIKDKEVKFVDLRFTDTRGKEQHVSVPVKSFGTDKFESGHFFDGSSIAGWKGIQASDMLLMPDPTSCFIDPFLDMTTLAISCDTIEPSDMKGYDRDPRSIAKRGEAYLKSTGLGDAAYFDPEPEFFIFDAVAWFVGMSAAQARFFRENLVASARHTDGPFNCIKDEEFGFGAEVRISPIPVDLRYASPRLAMDRGSRSYPFMSDGSMASQLIASVVMPRNGSMKDEVGSGMSNMSDA